MNSFTGFWLTFLASMSDYIFVGISCRPISSDQGRIRTSRWTSTKLDDDQNMMLRSEDTYQFAGRDDFTNEVAKNAPARPLSGAGRSRDSALTVEPFFEEYNDKECQYCKDDNIDEKFGVAVNYRNILPVIIGVLVILFLLIYVLYSCHHYPGCVHADRSEPSTTTKSRSRSGSSRKKVTFVI